MRRKRGWGMAAGVAAALAALPVAAQDAEPPRRLDENTAFMVSKNTLKLGVLSFEYGITDWLSIGTDPPAWAADLVSSVFIPNLHLEAALVRAESVQLSVKAGGYYANLKAQDGAEGEAIAIPLTGFFSFAVLPRAWLHLEANYNVVRAFGAGDLDRFEASGAAATESGQVGAMAELRLSRVVSLIARGRYQVFATPIEVESSSDFDDFTRASVDARIDVPRENPWSATAAVSFMWRHVHLALGAGYGSYFIPGVNIAVGDPGLIPEGSFSIYF